MTRSAPRSILVILITSMCLLMFIFFTSIAFYSKIKNVRLGSGSVVEYFCIAIFLFSLITYCFFSSTKQYEIENNVLKIITRKNTVVFKTVDIIEAKIIHQKDFGISYRVGAVGGVFGFFGSMITKHFGKVILYLNSFNGDLILLNISTIKDPIVICPKNAELFLKELKKQKL